MHFLGEVPGILHALFLANGNQLGSVGAHGCPALFTHVRRHNQEHAIALDRRSHRQCDTGIATGGFNQRVTRLYIAASLGFLNHADRRTVLYRTCGIITF